MIIRYEGNIKKFNIFQNNNYIGSISRKNPQIEVNEGKTIIKEVITGIAFIDFFLYGIIGFIDIFSNYVDGDLIDCNIFLITNCVYVNKDFVIDDYGFCDGGKYKLRTVVFKSSIVFYSICLLIGIGLLIYFGNNKEKEIVSLFILIGLIAFICYFYIMVNLIHTYNRYKKFLVERIGDSDGK